MLVGEKTLSEIIKETYDACPWMTLSEIAKACNVRQTSQLDGIDAVDFVKQAVGWQHKI